MSDTKKVRLGDKHQKITVETYIENCPVEVWGELEKIRAAIREAAPDATERTDYFQMPGYAYKGFDYNGMFAWFSYKKPNVRLHVRPPVIKEHAKELAEYKTTQSIVSFTPGKPIPILLVKKLVRASVEVMKKRSLK